MFNRRLGLNYFVDFALNELDEIVNSPSALGVSKVLKGGPNTQRSLHTPPSPLVAERFYFRFAFRRIVILNIFDQPSPGRYDRAITTTPKPAPRSATVLHNNNDNNNTHGFTGSGPGAYSNWRSEKPPPPTADDGLHPVESPAVRRKVN